MRVNLAVKTAGQAGTVRWNYAIVFLPDLRVGVLGSRVEDLGFKIRTAGFRDLGLGSQGLECRGAN